MENKPTRDNLFVWRLGITVGISLIIASLFRALSINNLIVAVSTGDISSHLAASAIIDWSLSSILLFLVGCWMLFLARDLKRGIRRAWWQALLISIAIAGFGAAFWFRYPSSLHLPLFLLIGLAMMIPLLLQTRHFKS